MDTSGLVAAVLTARKKCLQKWFSSSDAVAPTKISDETHWVNIPIWVMFETPYEGDPQLRPNTTIDEIVASNGSIWMCLTELMKSDLGVSASTSHRGEWFALSHIPTWCIKNVMPYDGETLYPKITHELIRSTASVENYFWNWQLQQWLHNPSISDYRAYREERIGDKRSRDDAEIDEVMAIIRSKLMRVKNRLG